MDASEFSAKLKQLNLDLDNLDDALTPLLNMHELIPKLPLLDRAKLFVLAAYAIASLVFAQLRLQGEDPRSHPVFKELARIRQYFDKISKLENPPEPRDKKLDVQAAIRFIKSDVDDREKAKKLSEQLAKEKAKTKLLDAIEKKRKAEDLGNEGSSSKGGKSKSKSRKLNQGQST